VKCVVRDRLRVDYDESVLRSPEVNETLAKVAGALAMAEYEVLLLEQTRCEAKVSKALAELNAHLKKHGC
jgi:hypothetical protein